MRTRSFLLSVENVVMQRHALLLTVLALLFVTFCAGCRQNSAQDGNRAKPATTSRMSGKAAKAKSGRQAEKKKKDIPQPPYPLASLAIQGKGYSFRPPRDWEITKLPLKDRPVTTIIRNPFTTEIPRPTISVAEVTNDSRDGVVTGRQIVDAIKRSMPDLNVSVVKPVHTKGYDGVIIEGEMTADLYNLRVYQLVAQVGNSRLVAVSGICAADKYRYMRAAFRESFNTFAIFREERSESLIEMPKGLIPRDEKLHAPL